MVPFAMLDANVMLLDFGIRSNNHGFPLHGDLLAYGLAASALGD